MTATSGFVTEGLRQVALPTRWPAKNTFSFLPTKLQVANSRTVGSWMRGLKVSRKLSRVFWASSPLLLKRRPAAYGHAARPRRISTSEIASKTFLAHRALHPIREGPSTPKLQASELGFNTASSSICVPPSIGGSQIAGDQSRCPDARSGRPSAPAHPWQPLWAADPDC